VPSKERVFQDHASEAAVCEKAAGGQVEFICQKFLYSLIAPDGMKVSSNKSIPVSLMRYRLNLLKRILEDIFITPQPQVAPARCCRILGAECESIFLPFFHHWWRGESSCYAYVHSPTGKR
jgi:hypothetical protein